MEKILVLMSVYNGEKYIKEQIESIFSQNNVSVTLLIRDDGSSDQTLDIVDSLSRIYNIDVYNGDNKGSAFSFLDLMSAANNKLEYQYFALSDQDDIWQNNKLSHAIEMLKKTHSDLYVGSLDAFCNEDLSTHKVIEGRVYSNFEAMLRNSVAGCTMVFTGNVLNRISVYKPRYIEMHDSLILRVCQYTGLKIVADKTPYIRYRIHGNNVCGASITPYQKVRAHIANLLYHDPKIASKTAHELLSGYNQYLQNDEKKYLVILDRESNIPGRKYKLLKYYRTEKFSNRSRKFDFFFETVFGKV